MESNAEETLQRRIRDGLVLEDPSEMTPRYRNVLVQTGPVAADLEIRTMPLDRVAMIVSESVGDRIAVASAMRDVKGHTQVMFRLLQEFGYDAYRRMFERDPAQFKTFSLLGWRIKDSIDTAVTIIRGDSPGYITTRDLEESCSFGPCSRSLPEVNIGEQLHVPREEYCLRCCRTLGREIWVRVRKSLDFCFPFEVERFGATGNVESCGS